jgi:hypothetical protein
MASLYRVGITLLLTDGVSPGLSRISHQLLGVHASASQINSQFGKWALAIGGAGAVMAGTTLLRGMSKVAAHGKELLDQQDKLIRAGRSQAEVANLTAEAYAKITKAVPTAKASDVLRVANELTLVKGNFADAAAAAAGALKLEALLGNATGRKSEGEGYNVWRALELKNVTMDHALTDKLMGGMVQSMIASGGRVTGLDWLTTARQGGVAWTQLSNDFMTQVLPSVMQELGGQRTGTSLMTAYQTLAGSATLRKQQLDMLRKIGIIDESKITTDKGGRVNIGPGAIRGAREGMADPYKWTQEVLKPALIAAGFTTLAQQREVMAKIFPNRNANRMFDIFLDPNSVARLEKDRQIYAGAKPLNQAYQSYITENPKGVEEAFHAQYKSMMEAVGAPMMKTAMPIMQAMTSMFSALGEFANTNPETIKIIGIGFGLLGAALVGAGAVAIIGAIGTGGWLIAGIAALGIAVAGIKHYFDSGPDAGKVSTMPTEGIGSIYNDPFSGAGAVPPPKSGAGGSWSGDINMDGKKVGEIVTKHQVASASGPVGGSSFFDGTAALIPTDYNLARG